MDGVMDGVSSATKPETARTADGPPPVLVLDNNVLRNEAVIDGCIARYRETGAQFALPEMVMFELTKHPDDWEVTVRRSLEYVLRCPEALVITHTAKDLGLAEEATGTPTERVVNEKITIAWRKLLADLREGDGPDLDYLRRAVPNLRARLRYEEYDTDSLATVQKLKNIATVFPRDLVARVGNDLAKDDRQSFREFLVGVYGIERLRDAHVHRGVAQVNADGLLSAPSVSYLFALAVGALGLEWMFRGGVDTANPRRVANDILDIEYAIPALWIGQLVAKDKGARQRFDDLKVLGAAVWPRHAKWFGRAEAVHPDDWRSRG
jgi:hypothetical protein